MKKWFTVNAKASEPTEILIYEQIGKDWFTNDGIGAKEFSEALAEIPKDKEIVVGINSPGGNVWDGLAIYHQLKARASKVTTRVDGVAASIASVIALAGKTVQMPKNALMMIHRAWGMAVGNAADMLKLADDLAKHDGVIASIYSDKNGKSRDENLKAMEAETWFTGEEAKAFGLVDDVTNGVAMSNVFHHKDNSPHLNKFAKSFETFQGLALRAEQTNANNAPAPDAHAPKISDSTSAADGSKTAPTNKNTTEKKTMDANTQAVANPPAIDLTPLLDEIKGLRAEIKDIKTSPNMGAEPIRPTIAVGSEGIIDVVNGIKNAKERYTFRVHNWSELDKAYRSPRGANTTDAQLVTDFLLDGATTVLTNRLAPLRAFAKEVSPDRVKPKAVLQHRKVTAGGTAQTNATSFEDTTNFVGTEVNVPITMAQLTSGGHITNAERQSGVTMDQWVQIKTAEISDAIMAAVAAVILEGSFTATPLVSAAAAFGAEEMKTLWGQLKKSPLKNIILDGEYFARFIPSTMENFDVFRVGIPGWDNVALNTVWTGATANTVGFACNPQAIVCGVGLPLRSDRANLVSSESVLALPDLGISVAVYNWYSNITRAEWATYDIMFGAAANDTTAGVLVKSA